MFGGAWLGRWSCCLVDEAGTGEAEMTVAANRGCPAAAVVRPPLLDCARPPKDVRLQAFHACLPPLGRAPGLNIRAKRPGLAEVQASAATTTTQTAKLRWRGGHDVAPPPFKYGICFLSNFYLFFLSNYFYLIFHFSIVAESLQDDISCYGSSVDMDNERFIS